MRLNEFYNPETDNFVRGEVVDLRKTQFTLEHLNKLRKIREIKEQEQKEYETFMSTMYRAAPSTGI
jgi:hypothetical protein